MPDLVWNAATWGAHYKWLDGGEEWSAAWGGSEAQWFGSLYPRLHRFLPASTILEIAPGYGRWSRFLISAATASYVGVDLNQNCTDRCSERFSSEPRARFVTNDGMSLDAVADGTCDLVFSFDSLVHAEVEVFVHYVPEILRKLSPRGVAFIHHSNLADHGPLNGKPTHSRATTVSASVIEDLIQQHGGGMVLQEVINWVEVGLIDCLTTFCKSESHSAASKKIINASFMAEAELVRKYQAQYSHVSTG